jgi:hypothetical protein
MTENKSVTEKSWEEFRTTGLLWWINSLLHVFGWSIVLEMKNEDKTIVERVYPARVVFRGFTEELNDDGYKKISVYMKENAEDLLDEVMYNE